MLNLLTTKLKLYKHILTKNQIICTVILLLNAGHEATVNTIGNSIVTLANNNIDTLDLDKKYNIKNIIEELIRFDSPLQFFQRWVLNDDEVGGVEVKKHSKVAILLGSANRDGEAFEDPEEIINTILLNNRKQELFDKLRDSIYNNSTKGVDYEIY